jgi:hypothetical protein
MSITDFAGTTSWCERFMRRNGLCIHAKTTIAQKLTCQVKTTVKMILVVVMIFWVSVMDKLYYGC